MTKRLPTDLTRHCIKLKPTQFKYVAGYDVWYEDGIERVPASYKNADFVTSETKSGLHAPVLDIDFEAKLINSSTPGHYHLYLDKEMSWAKYKLLLRVMAYVGLLEKDWVRSQIATGYTAIRTPWNRK